MLACTTTATVVTQPSRATLFVDGKKVAQRTPYVIKRNKSVFATGETHLVVKKEGYETETLILEQVADAECLGLSGGITLLIFWPALFWMPWCSEFEQTTVFIELFEPEPPASVSSPAPSPTDATPAAEEIAPPDAPKAQPEPTPGQRRELELDVERTSPSEAPTYSSDLYAELRKLEALHKDGLLTDEEFETLRSRAIERAK